MVSCEKDFTMAIEICGLVIAILTGDLGWGTSGIDAD